MVPQRTIWMASRENEVSRRDARAQRRGLNKPSNISSSTAPSRLCVSPLISNRRLTILVMKSTIALTFVLCFCSISHGEKSLSEKFNWTRFEVDGRPAFVILPEKEKRTEATPWIMYAPTFDKKLPSEKDEGWMIQRFLDNGIAIAGVDVGESYGSPKGRATYDALYAHLTTKHRLSPKACLLARSRGGLMLYNWAAQNSDKIACIAGIYPVCDLQSYPGLAKACGAYGMTEKQLQESLNKHNPVNRLASLAKAKVPIFHIHGDQDKVVPFDENSGQIAKNYRELGGKIELVVAKGQWHNMWHGFFHCEALVDFVIKNARPPSKAEMVE